MKTEADDVGNQDIVVKLNLPALADWDAAARPLLQAVAQVAAVIQAGVGELVRIADAIRPVIEENWGEPQAALVRLQEGTRRFEQALRNAEEMGRAGWTIPLDADFNECIRLLEQARTSESADAAFLDFYTRDKRGSLVLLVADLQRHPRLVEFRDLLDQVWFGLDTEKYLLVVPALLTLFEGAARRCWDNGVWDSKRRRTFLAQKIQGLKPDSFARVAWTATSVFVDTLYAPNFGADPKPAFINRHWILHGKGPADSSLVDCLRLLQAIHTVVLLAEDLEAETQVPEVPSPVTTP